MKTIIQSLGAIALAAAVIGTATAHQHSGGCCGGQPRGFEEKPVPAKEKGGVQKATVVIDNGKYTPSAISVKKDKPVEITFKGGKNMGCGSTVVFKTLKQTKTVETGKTVTFKFTPKKAGDVPFTCSMDMFQGKVIVK